MSAPGQAEQSSIWAHVLQMARDIGHLQTAPLPATPHPYLRSAGATVLVFSPALSSARRTLPRSRGVRDEGA